MVSYEAKLPNQEEDDLVRLYGRETFDLVCAGYRRIYSYFDSVKAKGEFRGNFLKEVLHKLPAVPPLLNTEEYERFLKFSTNKDPYTAEDMLNIIGDILEQVFGERRLLSAITTDHKNGQVLVILH